MGVRWVLSFIHPVSSIDGLSPSKDLSLRISLSEFVLVGDHSLIWFSLTCPSSRTDWRDRRPLSPRREWDRGFPSEIGVSSTQSCLRPVRTNGQGRGSCDEYPKVSRDMISCHMQSLKGLCLKNSSYPSITTKMGISFLWSLPLFVRTEVHKFLHPGGKRWFSLIPRNPFTDYSPDPFSMDSTRTL